MLRDVANIWTSAIQPIQDDGLRQRLNFHAVDAFVAVAQCHIRISGNLPKFTPQTALELLNAGLGSDYTRPMATYAIAMILNLGKFTRVAAVTNEIQAEGFIEILLSLNDDLEKATVEEDAVDLRIYSTLVLLKLQPELDTARVEGLLGQMEKTIGDSPIRDSGIPRKSGTDTSADLDRVRWKAIYLSALLFKFMPDDWREKRVGGLRARVETLVDSGELSSVGDYEHCIEPLGLELPELKTPAVDQQGPINTAFEVWIDEFPLFPLAGSIALAKP